MKSLFYKIGEFLFNLTVGAVLFVLSKVDKNGQHALSFFRELFLKRYQLIIDYNTRALYPSRYFTPSRIKTTTQPGELAIVIQGVITEKDDFTLETVRFYKKLFKGAIIILSTWDSTSKELLKKFKDEGCFIVLSKMFKPSGLGNVNYQICTSFSGINKAKELGAKYVLKNRSDLRIYREFSFEYMKTLLEIYPVLGKEIPLKGRILTLSGLAPQIVCINSYQDFMYFGYTDDMYALFDIPYDERGDDVFASSSRRYFDCKYNGVYNAKEVCLDRTPEVYITTAFLSKYKECGMTVKDSWQFFHDYFLVLDFKAIEAIWYKYQRYTVYGESEGKKACLDRNRNFNSILSACIITDKLIYADWLENEAEKCLMGSKINRDWLKGR